MCSQNLIKAGRIIKPHGIKGEVCIDSYVDSPSLLLGSVFLQQGNEVPKPLLLLKARPHQGRLLGVFEEVVDRNAAEEIRGAYLLVARNRLPKLDEGEFYLHDLLGLEVLLQSSGESVGRIEDVDLSTGQEIWVIRTSGGKEILFPGVPEFVSDIDLEQGQVVISPPEGLLERYV